MRAILQDEATHVDAKSDDFWVLAAALRAFVEEEGHGALPLQARTFSPSLLPLPLSLVVVVLAALYHLLCSQRSILFHFPSLFSSAL